MKMRLMECAYQEDTDQLAQLCQSYINNLWIFVESKKGKADKE